MEQLKMRLDQRSISENSAQTSYKFLMTIVVRGELIACLFKSFKPAVG